MGLYEIRVVQLSCAVNSALDITVGPKHYTKRLLYMNQVNDLPQGKITCSSMVRG